MSHQLINRSPDLKRLRDEGFDIEVRAGFLVVKNVPYVNANAQVQRGTLVSELTLALGDLTTTPGSHQAYFGGDYPCNANGSQITQIAYNSARQELAPGLIVDHFFSSKPLSGGYSDYYEKVTIYVSHISGAAQILDPTATARTFSPILDGDEESVFCYMDTASSRAEIGMVTRKLRVGKVALIGVGGTGSYVLDLLAKTPVGEIHLFDRDEFLQHNAFRAPGAPSVEQFGTAPKKVAYFQEIYSKMRRDIVGHAHHVDASNVEMLQEMNFVFLCIDSGEAKRFIVEKLEEFDIPFIDVGMGVDIVGDSLRGIVRLTTSTREHRSHFRQRVSLADAQGNGDYDRNIQIADLNALNAALAVIKWKKLCGFYLDLENEYHCTYTVDGNMLLSEDQ